MGARKGLYATIDNAGGFKLNRSDLCVGRSDTRFAKRLLRQADKRQIACQIREMERT